MPIVSPNKADARGKLIQKHAEENNIICLANGTGTRYNEQTGEYSAIDITFASAKNTSKIGWEVLEQNLGSDHQIIRISVAGRPHTESRPARLNFKKADWLLYKKEVIKRLGDRLPYAEVEENTKHITLSIMEAARASIPTKKSGGGRVLVPYWNDTCTKAVNMRNKALKQMKKHRDRTNTLKYHTAKAHAQKTIRDAQETQWMEYCSSLSTNTSPKEVWNTVRSMQGTHKTQTTPNISAADGSILSNLEKAKELANFFADTSSDRNYDPIFLDRKNNHRPTHIPISQPHHPASSPITLAEIRTALKNMGNTAAGPDGVTYELLRQLPQQALNTLKELYNQSWLSGKVPAQWKTAVVIPLLKPGKPDNRCTSYRPVSLTAVIGKLLEKIIHRRLDWYLESNNLYNPSQSGFRQNRGCADQIARLAHDAALATNDYGTLSVFLDVEKAFDMVWRESIIDKLILMKIPSRFTFWVRSFLTSREIQVRVGNDISPPTHVQNGTPQGSVLSPLLFNILLSSIPTPKDTKTSIYADDIAVWSISNKPSLMTRAVQNQVTRIDKYLGEIGLKIAAGKTNFMLTTRSNKMRKTEIKLNIREQPIGRVKSFKFLGMHFDELASWKIHSKELAKRCDQRLNVMRAISGLRWGASQSTLLTIYRTLIRPLLDHGCEGLEYATKEVKATLETIQNKALAICCGSLRGTPVAALQVECGEPPLDLRRRRIITNLAAKAKIVPKNPLKHTFFPSNSIPWKKEREDKLKKIMEKRNPGGYGPDHDLLSNLFHPTASTTGPTDTLSHISPPITQLTMKDVKIKTSQKFVSDWQRRWDDGHTGRAFKEIEKEVRSRTRNPRQHREKEVTKIRLRNGHCKLNGPLHKLGLHPTGECPHCPGKKEDRNHLLMECPATETLREDLKKTLGEPISIEKILSRNQDFDLIYTWVKNNIPGGL